MNCFLQNLGRQLHHLPQHIITVAFNFDDDAVEDDVAAYLSFVKDNSCVALGQPAMEEPNVSISKETSGEESNMDGVVVDSSSNTIAFSTATVAALVMALATSMVL